MRAGGLAKTHEKGILILSVANSARSQMAEASTGLAIAMYVPHDRDNRAFCRLDDLRPEVEDAR